MLCFHAVKMGRGYRELELDLGANCRRAKLRVGHKHICSPPAISSAPFPLLIMAGPLVEEKMMYYVLCGKQPHFLTAETKFQVECRMECRWAQAEGLYMIFICFENIAKILRKKPWKFDKSTLKTLEKDFLLLFATLSIEMFKFSISFKPCECSCSISMGSTYFLFPCFFGGK